MSIVKYLLSVFIVVIMAGCAGQTTVTDYGNVENWAYYGIGSNKPADIFLVAPSVVSGSAGDYNAVLTDTLQKMNMKGALNMERGIYDSLCCLYAPYYRQATLYAYTQDSVTSAFCFESAYQDVRAAFLYYIKNCNHQRPFVLAGFSQGADMCLRLLKEFFDAPRYDSLLVAAYLIGWRITSADTAAFPHLKMATGETDLGTIISFNSEADTVSYSVIVPYRTLSINPVSWTTDFTAASAQEHQGACFTDYSGKIVREIPHFSSCHIDPQRGTLKVTDITPADYPPILSLFSEGVYHIYDYQFFFRNLEENVQKRVINYYKVHKKANNY